MSSDDPDPRLALADAPFWGALQILDLGGNVFADDLPALDLQELRVLELSEGEMYDEGFESLLGLELPMLEALNLRGNAISPAGLARLAGEARWRGLRRLGIDDVDDATLDAILGAFPRLVRLEVGLAELGVRGLRTVIDDPRFHPDLKTYAQTTLERR